MSNQTASSSSGNSAIGTLVLIGVLIGGGYLVDKVFFSPTTTSSSSAESDEKIEAWVIAQQFVKDKLKSPGSASFGSVLKGDYQSPQERVTKTGPDRFRVDGWVDAQNSFGALVRTKFTITLEKKQNGTWVATDGPQLVSN